MENIHGKPSRSSPSASSPLYWLVAWVTNSFGLNNCSWASFSGFCVNVAEKRSLWRGNWLHSNNAAFRGKYRFRELNKIRTSKYYIDAHCCCIDTPLTFSIGWNIMLRAIWYHLYNLKNVKNTHRGTPCNFTKTNTSPWVFVTLLKFYKWYQIVQSMTYDVLWEYAFLKNFAIICIHFASI